MTLNTLPPFAASPIATVPAFWAGACALSGRIDLLSLAEAHGGWDGLGAALADPTRKLGLRQSQLTVLQTTAELPSALPWMRLSDPEYPEILRNCPYAPPVLFYSGDLGQLRKPGVAVVGARRCSDPGRRFAGDLARRLAEMGVCVVSGLAWGIDEAAHTGAPSATIAVLGQGIHTLTGRARRLAEGILDAGGLILSEFPPDKSAQKYTFPQRNRVIAGLSQHLVVVEAAIRSGSLTTAQAALELGREVWAVPGAPWSPHAEGCLRLLSEGAGLLRSPDDLLGTMGLAREVSQVPPDPLLRLLSDAPDFDTLLDRSGLRLPQLVARLAELELAGLVERLPGDRLRARPATGKTPKHR